MQIRGQRVELSDAQETRLQQAKGRAIRFALERLIAAPGYQRMSDEQRAGRLRRALDQARRRSGQQQRGLVVREARQAQAVAR